MRVPDMEPTGVSEAEVSVGTKAPEQPIRREEANRQSDAIVHESGRMGEISPNFRLATWDVPIRPIQRRGTQFHWGNKFVY